jgi:DNA-binding XRE family transcriptional regulator
VSEKTNKAKEIFSMNLRVYMAIFKITQRELGKKCGLSNVTISYYISGKKNPNLGSAAKIAEALNVSIEDLFTKKTYH